MDEKEILDRIAQVYSNAWRQCGENRPEFFLMCQMLLCYPEHQEMLNACLNSIEQCCNAKIDPFVLVKAGMMIADFPLMKLAYEDAKRKSEVEKTIADIQARYGSLLKSPLPFPRYAPDERVAFARIYVERFLFSPHHTLNEMLTDYAFTAYQKQADPTMLHKLRKRYYRFVERFYRVRVEEKGAYDPSSGLPDVSKYVPISRSLWDKEPHLERISYHHFFELRNKRGDYCYLSYLKGKKQFWLRTGSTIVRNFNASATAHAEFLKKTIEQGDVIFEENQEYCQLKKSIKVSSPSFAASLVLGCKVSGVKKWRNSDDKTMQQVLKMERIDEANSRSLRKKKRAAAKRPKPPKQDTKVSSSKSS